MREPRETERTGVVVTSRPVVMSRISWASSVFVLAAFVATALLMKRDNAGASFGDKDQVATVVIGIIVAALLYMPSYPRLVADTDSIRIRSFLGDFRTVPWDVIVRIDFPTKVRFARIVLPGEETLPIYAVQRLDKERSVDTMARLRALWATTHPDA